MTERELGPFECKDAECVRQCVEAGDDPNCRHPRFGHTPLYNSVRMDFPEVATALIEVGADVNLTFDYRSPVDGRLEKQSLPLMYARSAEMVEVLVAAGAQVDARSGDGHTPLISSVKRRNADVVDALLSFGASPDIRDGHGRTAKQYAELEKAKLKKGIGCTPVEKARLKKVERILALLAPSM